MGAIEHHVKCWPTYFDATARGDKTFDVRKDDRGYQKGDVLVLEKYDPNEGLYVLAPGLPRRPQTHRSTITWILTGGQFGIKPGYVVLGLRPVQTENE